jgi:signal transduction histidine kinase
MKKPYEDSNWLRIGIVIAGMLISILGILVLIGWYIHSFALVQLLSNLPPMQANAALCFLIAGIGLISTSFNRLKVSYICGLIVGSIGLATLVEYLFEIDLFIDQLFIKPFTTVSTSHPGRMSLIAAFCWLIGGSALLLISIKKGIKHQSLIIGLLGSIIVAISCSAFFGYLAGTEAVLGWGHFTKMAIHTALGLIIFGFTIVFLSIYSEKNKETALPLWLSYLVGFGAITATFYLWNALSSQEVVNLNRVLEEEAETAKFNLEKRLENYINSLIRIAKHSEAEDEPLSQNWQGDVKYYLKQENVYKSIEWIDASYRIRWTTPIENNEDLIGQDLSIEPSALKIMEEVKAQKEIGASHLSILSHGGKGIFIFIPIYRKGSFEGFLLGVLRYKEILENALEESTRDRYIVTLLHKNEEIIRLDASNSSTSSLVKKREIVINKERWYLQLSPTEKTIYSLTSSIPTATLVLGLLMSSLLILSVRFSQISSLRLKEAKTIAKELEERNIQLAKINQELDDFVYIASHDLKEPLRGIHNYSAILIEDHIEKLDSDARSKLETLMRLTQRLEDLIDSLLHFSRLSQKDLSIEEIDLNQSIANVIDSLQFSLKEAEVEIKIPNLLPVTICNRTGVEEIFSNLITNAMKYNDKSNKWIEIGSMKHMDEDKAISTSKEEVSIFYVKDNGIGIPEKHKDSIFRLFKRLHAREKFGGGTGAGLTIVKKLVEKHGGKIWLDSMPGKGTTFYFTLVKETEDDSYGRPTNINSRG